MTQSKTNAGTNRNLLGDKRKSVENIWTNTVLKERPAVLLLRHSLRCAQMTELFKQKTVFYTITA